MSNEVMAQIIAHSINLCGMNAQDRRDARLYMNEATWIRVKVSTMTYIGRPRQEQIEALGIPVQIDNTVPDNEVQLFIGSVREHRQRLELAAAYERARTRNLPMTWKERVRSWLTFVSSRSN